MCDEPLFGVKDRVWYGCRCGVGIQQCHVLRVDESLSPRYSKISITSAKDEGDVVIYPWSLISHT